LQLSGVGAPAGVALNSAIIGGSIGNSVWSIVGAANKISAAAFTAPLTINATNIYTIQVRGSATGAIITAANLIRSILTTGPVDSTTHFSAAAYGKAILDGVKVDPVTDPHFSVT
jgi:hypothetical protein